MNKFGLKKTKKYTGIVNRYENSKGKFEIDFGTVYKHPTHEFYHKWGPVMPIEDYISSIGSSGGGFSKAALPKAHIKCDITIQAKGDKVQVIMKTP